MSTTNEFMLKINYNEYPMLKSLKKKDSEKLIGDIFNAGYKLYFPNKDQLIKNKEFDKSNFIHNINKEALKRG